MNKRIIISKDGDKIVVASNQSEYFAPYLLERSAAVRDSFVLTKLPVDEGRDFFPESLSPNGKLISMVSENLATLRFDVFVYDLDMKKVQNITRTDDIDDAVPKFSPASDDLAFLSDGKLRFYYCRTGKFRSVDCPDNVKFRNLTWTVDGQRIFLEDDSCNIWKYDDDSHAVQLIWKAPEVSNLTSHLITPDKYDDNVFYFVSDHGSDFNQIYKYGKDGRISPIIVSNQDKYLIQRPVDSNQIFYKVNEDGNFIIEKYQNGKSIRVGPSHGVCYDYFNDPSNGNLFLYANLSRPASLFLENKGKWQDLLNLTSVDSLPAPSVFHNKAGMLNFVYRSKTRQDHWVIWLHGGPNEQMSMRFNIYLVQLIKAGWNIVVLNYPGSTGVGNRYEFRELSPPALLDVQVRTIREDILSIRSVIPDLQRYSIIGVSHGSIAAHAYAHEFKNDVVKLVDFSGMAVYSSSITSAIPTLYIYGEYDFSIKRRARMRLIEDDLTRGNGRRLILRNEGHVINHRGDIMTVSRQMDSFLSYDH